MAFKAFSKHHHSTFDTSFTSPQCTLDSVPHLGLTATVLSDIYPFPSPHPYFIPAFLLPKLSFRIPTHFPHLCLINPVRMLMTSQSFSDLAPSQYLRHCHSSVTAPITGHCLQAHLFCYTGTCSCLSPSTCHTPT